MPELSRDLTRRQLPNLHARFGDRVKPTRRQLPIACEEPVDRVVALDVAFADVEENDASIEGERIFVKRRGRALIDGQQIELIFVGGSQNFARWRIVGEADVCGGSCFVLMAFERLGNGGLQVSMKKPTHRRMVGRVGGRRKFATIPRQNNRRLI